MPKPLLYIFIAVGVLAAVGVGWRFLDKRVPPYTAIAQVTVSQWYVGSSPETSGSKTLSSKQYYLTPGQDVVITEGGYTETIRVLSVTSQKATLEGDSPNGRTTAVLQKNESATFQSHTVDAGTSYEVKIVAITETIPSH